MYNNYNTSYKISTHILYNLKMVIAFLLVIQILAKFEFYLRKYN